jgi:phosphatidate cytidylyltransferase
VLRTRLITAAIALPIVLAIVIWAPPEIFNGFIGVLTVWGLYEISEMTEAGPVALLLLLVCGMMPATILLLRSDGPWLLPAIAVFSMTSLTVRVGRRGPEDKGLWLVLLGAVWVGALFPYFAWVRNGPSGIKLIILILLLVVASDSGAYFVGRAFGRIKLLPKVSPHKTVEGAIGGIAACVIAALMLRRWLAPEFTAARITGLGIAIAVLAQLGDLANSAYKRVARVKDSGWLFPGHGGLLDRTCSLVFPVVFTYYYLYYA